MTLVTELVPPQNLEAERSVLGACLIDKSAFARVLEILDEPEIFYRQAHQTVFDAMRALHDRNEPVDYITLTNELGDRLAEVGGAEYVMELVEVLPTAANVEYYAHIVRERAIRRELIHAGTSIVQMAHEPAYDVAEVVANAEKQVYAVAEKRIAQDFLPLKKVLTNTFGRLEAIYEGKGGVIGIPTGYRDLDEMTGGLQRSNFIIIAARPSMGKTAFAMNIAQNVARQGTPVAIFSMEMSNEELGARILSSEARIEGDRLKNGRLHESDWANLAKVMSHLNNVPLFLDDSSGLTVMEIASKARKLAKNQGLGMIMIDYIQLISGPMRKEANRVMELAEISRQLKFLAKELKIPVIALSQLARGVESRNDKRPMLSDLRDSGAIEQEADLVMFIYRDEYYNPHSDQKGIAEIIIAKQRSGRTGKLELHFSNQYVKFENLARMHGT